MPTYPYTACAHDSLSLAQLLCLFLGILSPLNLLAEETLQLEEVTLDTRPLPVQCVPAFPNIEWSGWKPTREDGRVESLRPILLTHAGDGSGRIFVPNQHGVIFVIAPEQDPMKANVFLDLRSKVSFQDTAIEEGFLGLAFHPQFQGNGRFFVYYTNKHEPHQNVVSSFRIDPDNPDSGKDSSEEILLVLDKPYSNHDGGTICFGPDGYLYIAVGDGGSANDPCGNGQNLGTMLGKILRIDVDQHSDTQPYSIPADNPFVEQSDARPEIWAYGLRNVWRMAFDPVTQRLWAGDVGQDKWEEIDLVVRGGNYGWNVREGLHPFGAPGATPGGNYLDPIWEYPHDTGKSIIGGIVYRGQQIPELQGGYLYADYVAGRVWAIYLDDDGVRVKAQREIQLSSPTPIISFGTDERGEAYFMNDSPDGQGIFRIAPQN